MNTEPTPTTTTTRTRTGKRTHKKIHNGQTGFNLRSSSFSSRASFPYRHGNTHNHNHTHTHTNTHAHRPTHIDKVLTFTRPDALSYQKQRQVARHSKTAIDITHLHIQSNLYTYI